MSDRILKKHIILKINEIADHNSLVQLDSFLNSIKPKSNKKEIFSFLAHAGSISEDEGNDMQKIIDQEFNTIEGEW